ncbi:MAG: ribosomal L7Ae/L30e/S12e/Gadd45 family protein [Eubacteriales bacterium]|nr:ribosomal L7Ae/L30e/S12e/Gadd45 family protein [Eubacteriales bacterium]HCG67959.1 hypothetical protein [Clostridiales bacterium]
MQKRSDAQAAAMDITRGGARGDGAAHMKEKTNETQGSAPPFEPGSPGYSGAAARLLGDVGLCARARMLVRGTDMVCDALKSGGVLLVLAASDNSQNTAKRLRDRCSYYGVRLMLLPATGEQLAAATGRGGVTAAVGITDASMVRMIEKAALPLGI